MKILHLRTSLLLLLLWRRLTTTVLLCLFVSIPSFCFARPTSPPPSLVRAPFSASSSSFVKLPESAVDFESTAWHSSESVLSVDVLAHQIAEAVLNQIVWTDRRTSEQTHSQQSRQPGLDEVLSSLHSAEEENARKHEEEVKQHSGHPSDINLPSDAWPQDQTLLEIHEEDSTAAEPSRSSSGSSQAAGAVALAEEGNSNSSFGSPASLDSPEALPGAKKGRVMIALTDLTHGVKSPESWGGEALPPFSNSLARLEEDLQSSASVADQTHYTAIRSNGIADANRSPENVVDSSAPPSPPPGTLGERRRKYSNAVGQVVQSYQILPTVGIVVVDFNAHASQDEVAETVRSLWLNHPEVWLVEADTEVTFRTQDTSTAAAAQAEVASPPSPPPPPGGTGVVRKESEGEKTQSTAEWVAAEQQRMGPAAGIVPNDELFGHQWALENSKNFPPVDVRAVGAWSLIYEAGGAKRKKGQGGLVVSHIDTGCDVHHPDLKNNIWVNPREIPHNGIDDDENGYIDDIHGWDFDRDASDVKDEHGHGTHTAGILAAQSNNGMGVAGLGWDLKLMILKFKNSVSDAVAAIEYSLSMGVRVSTNSWGFNTPVESLRLVLQQADRMRHLFVCAVDNKGRDNTWFNDFPPNYPFPNMIRVASVNAQADLDVTSDFSKTKVDIAAPGKRVLSAVPRQIYGTDYAYKDGTSMATPLVAGLAALLLSLDSSMDIYRAKQVVLNTVTPLTAIESRIRTGGIINCENAVKSVLGIPFSPPAPISNTRTAEVPTDLIANAGHVSELLFAGFNELLNGFLIRAANSSQRADLIKPLAVWDLVMLRGGKAVEQPSTASSGQTGANSDEAVLLKEGRSEESPQSSHPCDELREEEEEGEGGDLDNDAVHPTPVASSCSKSQSPEVDRAAKIPTTSTHQADIPHQKPSHLKPSPHEAEQRERGSAVEAAITPLSSIIRNALKIS